MQLKPIIVTAVLSLVVASLLVSGCTTNTGNSSTNVTPRNGELVRIEGTNDYYAYYNGLVLDFLDHYHKQLSAEQTPTYKLTDWRESRIDDTTMSVYWVFSNTTRNRNETTFVTATAKLFPTNGDALSFVNAHNMGMKQSSERNFYTIDSTSSYETKSHFVMYTNNFVIHGDQKVDEY
jgi:hypothetical protein